MKKVFIKTAVKFLIFASVITISFTSCKSRKEVPVTLKSTEIEGDMGDFYEISNKSYSLIKEKDDDCFRIKIELKRKDKPFGFDYDIAELASRGWVKLACDLYDDKGSPTVLAEDVYGSLSFSENDIINLKPGKTAWVELAWCYNNDKIMKTKSISFKSSINTSGGIQRTEDSESNSESSSSISSSESGSQDWDKLLSDYESYTDKYIALLTKAKNGDASAMTEYIDMLGKATELQESLMGSDGVMSPSQLQKFTKIQQKLLTAASSL
jgi:hypothetical protein